MGAIARLGWGNLSLATKFNCGNTTGKKSQFSLLARIFPFVLLVVVPPVVPMRLVFG